MSSEHTYTVEITWTGNRGEGTTSYRAYGRDHEINADHKPMLPGSADPAFRGDAERWNPEELLVAAVSQCHMLWFLHLCAVNNLIVTAYKDNPVGTMVQDKQSGGGGRFTEIVLHPEITLTEPAPDGTIESLHDKAHGLCFIANSVNFPVHIASA